MWVRSFILHFSRAVVFAAVVIMITVVMDYLYVDDTDEFARAMLHELYGEQENIDRLYVGSSHVFCDIDPFVLDEINGENNFNLATGNQQLIASYYLIREAHKKHEIGHVYLDLYYVCTTAGMGNLHDYAALPHSWIVLNQMKPSVNKLSYMLSLSDPAYYYLTFFPFTRYKEQLFQPDYVGEIVDKKREQTWKNHDYYHIRKMEDREFVMENAGKGYMQNFGVPETGGFYGRESALPLTESPVTEESLAYLVKIVDYCRENDIELTWIACPVSDFQLAGNGTYDNFAGQVSELAAQYDVPYYDFNLCKKEYLDLTDNQYWSDKGHLNSAGAEVFTEFLGKFLQAAEAGQDTYADCFHNRYQEKMQAADQAIFGLEIVASDEYDKYLPEAEKESQGKYALYKIHPVTNAEEGQVEIHVCRLEESEEESRGFGRKEYTPAEEINVLYDGNDGYVILDAEEHGFLYIEAKLKDSAKIRNWVEIEY